MRRRMDIIVESRHQQSIFVIEILGPRWTPGRWSSWAPAPIVGMNALNDHVERDKRRLVVAEYSESFLRPDDFAGGDAPAEAPGVAQSLCFGKIVPTLPQGVFGLLALVMSSACDQERSAGHPAVAPPGVFHEPKAPNLLYGPFRISQLWVRPISLRQTSTLLRTRSRSFFKENLQHRLPTQIRRPDSRAARHQKCSRTRRCRWHRP